MWALLNSLVSHLFTFVDIHYWHKFLIINRKSLNYMLGNDLYVDKFMAKLDCDLGGTLS